MKDKLSDKIKDFASSHHFSEDVFETDTLSVAKSKTWFRDQERYTHDSEYLLSLSSYKRVKIGHLVGVMFGILFTALPFVFADIALKAIIEDQGGFNLFSEEMLVTLAVILVIGVPAIFSLRRNIKRLTRREIKTIPTLYIDKYKIYKVGSSKGEIDRDESSLTIKRPQYDYYATVTQGDVILRVKISKRDYNQLEEDGEGFILWTYQQAGRSVYLPAILDDVKYSEKEVQELFSHYKTKSFLNLEEKNQKSNKDINLEDYETLSVYDSMKWFNDLIDVNSDIKRRVESTNSFYDRQKANKKKSMIGSIILTVVVLGLITMSLSLYQKGQLPIPLTIATVVFGLADGLLVYSMLTASDRVKKAVEGVLVKKRASRKSGNNNSYNYVLSIATSGKIIELGTEKEIYQELKEYDDVYIYQTDSGTSNIQIITN